jgi:hypothetical protein
MPLPTEQALDLPTTHRKDWQACEKVIIKQREILRESARQFNEKYCQEVEKTANKYRRPTGLEKGDVVYAEIPRKGIKHPKMQARYRGPLEIIENHDSYYTLRDSEGKITKLNANKVKKGFTLKNPKSFPPDPFTSPKERSNRTPSTPQNIKPVHGELGKSTPARAIRKGSILKKKRKHNLSTYLVKNPQGNEAWIEEKNLDPGMVQEYEQRQMLKKGKDLPKETPRNTYRLRPREKNPGTQTIMSIVTALCMAQSLPDSHSGRLTARLN